MKITIQSHKSEGKEVFEFTLQDGPEDREKIRGYATDLIVVFSKLIEWTERISADYREQEEQAPSIPSDGFGYAGNEGSNPFE